LAPFSKVTLLTDNEYVIGFIVAKEYTESGGSRARLQILGEYYNGAIKGSPSPHRRASKPTPVASCGGPLPRHSEPPRNSGKGGGGKGSTNTTEDCNALEGSPTNFQHKIFALMSGWPSLLSANQLLLLARQFMATYNSFNAPECGFTNNRVVTSVNAKKATSSGLKVVNGIDELFGLYFEVHVRCYGCQGDQNLFRLDTATKSLRKLKNGKDMCLLKPSTVDPNSLCH
jgi:hypothetical protein